MSKQTATIPLSTIERIQIYINTAKKSLATIKAETGADYIVNGGLYNMSTFKPVCHLKADGMVHARDQYTYWGYSWNAADISMTVVPNSTEQNYICCNALIDANGKVDKLAYTSAQGGARGRTAIGIAGDKLCLYVSGDGTADAKTPESLRDELISLGCTSAIMLDSGGSSQCDFAGKQVTSDRKVHNLIMVYLKKEDHGMDIIQRIMTKNRCYTNQVKCSKSKAMLHSTGTPGATTANIIAAWDKLEADCSVEFVIDDTGIYQTLPLGIRSWHSGSTANGTHVACEICEPIQTRVLSANWLTLSKGGKDNTVYAVTLLQKELTALGYDPKGIDGSFGSGTDAALRACQKAKGLTVDGYCGKATLKALQNRKGSSLQYPASEVQAYFENVYAKAVSLFAYLMEELGGDPAEILCHAEGYKAGIASNHADVLHWFPEHGKSMDDFRADVQSAMTPRITLDEAVDKLVLAGIVTTPEYWKDGLYSTANVQTLIIKMAAAMK